MSTFNATEQIRLLECYNQNANAVPSWGLMNVISIDPNTGILTVDQPSADGQFCVVNDGVAIPSQSYGTCIMDWPYWMAYYANDGTPAVGDEWGAANGYWELRKGRKGYIVEGVDLANNRVLVRPVINKADVVRLTGGAANGNLAPGFVQVWNGASPSDGGPCWVLDLDSL